MFHFLLTLGQLDEHISSFKCIKTFRQAVGVCAVDSAGIKLVSVAECLHLNAMLLNAALKAELCTSVKKNAHFLGADF